MANQPVAAVSAREHKAAVEATGMAAVAVEGETGSAGEVAVEAATGTTGEVAVEAATEIAGEVVAVGARTMVGSGAGTAANEVREEAGTAAAAEPITLSNNNQRHRWGRCSARSRPALPT